MIRAVVFDLGNVVCAFEPHRRLTALAQCTGLDADRIHEAIWTSGLDFRAEAGDLSPVDVERALLDALGNRIDAVRLRAAWSTAFIPDLAVCEVINGLAHPSLAFSNNGPMFTDCLAHELNAIARLFQRVICSWQVRARKPDPTAFVRLCAEVQRPPEELLFIDDNATNAESARSVGLTAITFTCVERLAEDLEQIRDWFP